MLIKEGDQGKIRNTYINQVYEKDKKYVHGEVQHSGNSQASQCQKWASHTNFTS